LKGIQCHLAALQFTDAFGGVLQILHQSPFGRKKKARQRRAFLGWA
jgi:hypothetical protein